MITLNKTGIDDKPIPIPHNCNPSKLGRVMTKEELHHFGIELMAAFLYNQDGKHVGINLNIGNDYPHLIIYNPKGVLLYIWIKTEMFPSVPTLDCIEDPGAAITLAKQFKAIPVFTGVVLKCVSNQENSIPICGGMYSADFIDLKEIKLRY